MTSKLLQDKVVFITGGGQGIGFECAKAYSDEGAQVVIADISLEKAQQSASQLSGDAIALHCDVGDSASVDSAIQAALRPLWTSGCGSQQCGHRQSIQAAA